VTVGIILVIAFSIYRYILVGSNPALWPILYIYGSSFAFFLGHYFLSKKFKFAANLFSAV